MKERVEDVFSPLFCLFFAARNVLVVIGYTTHIFHGSHVVIGTKNLVKLVEWIGSRKHFLVVENSVFRNSKPVLSNFLYVLLDGLSAVDFHWNFFISVFGAGIKLVVGSSTHAIQVGAYGSGFIELKNVVRGSTKRRLHLFGDVEVLEGHLRRTNIKLDTVSSAHNHPTNRRKHQKIVRGFDVWLIEAREPEVGVVGLGICV